MPLKKAFTGHRLIAAAKLARWERQIVAALHPAIAKHRAHALAQLRHVGTITASIPSDIFGADSWADDATGPVEQSVYGIFGEIRNGTAAKFGIGAPDLPEIDVTQRAGNLVDHVVGVGQRTADRLTQSLTQGVNAGEDYSKLADRVGSIFDSTESDAMRIARTEVAGAANSVSDEYAQAIHAGGLALQRTWLCLDGDARIAGYGTAIARRWESGPLIQLRWATGRRGDALPANGRLTVTPDHPILTDRGWISAKFVREGDRVFGDRYSVERVTIGVQPDVEQLPPTIAEVFAAANERSARTGMMSVVPDLDSDGWKRDVDVVPTDGELRRRLYAAVPKRIKDGPLALSDVELARLLRRGAGTEAGGAHQSALVRLRRFAHRFHRGGAVKHPATPSGGTLISQGDTLLAEKAADGRLRATGNLGEVPLGRAGEVSAYEVIGVIEVQGGRHVYDLQTPTGWLVAGGIIVHNSTLDERTRGNSPKDEFDHVSADGETVGMDEPFVQTGEELMYPGDESGSPGNIVNCRCTVIYAEEGTEYGDDLHL